MDVFKHVKVVLKSEEFILFAAGVTEYAEGMRNVRCASHVLNVSLNASSELCHFVFQARPSAPEDGYM